MILPRKVPWRSQSELAQLHQWIYADPSDYESRQRAIRRLKSYLALHPTSHPISISSTLSLLLSLSLCSPASSSDSSSNPSQPPRYTIDPHALRLSLSLSLVRFINTLVDPLQQGQFARPIAMLAADLGIPGWLVELRHMGTHESLPSLEILREGAEEALNYLNQSFYLPTLYPSASSSSSIHNLAITSSSSSSPAFLLHLPLFSPLLQRHKTLSKSLTKDRSQSDINLALRQLKRDIRTWLDTAERLGGAGAGVDAFVERLTGRMEGEDQGGEEEEEVAGVLVPVSKKKRSRFSSSSPHPPEHLLSLYGPLLQSFSRLYPSLPSTLISRIILILSTPSTPSSIFSSSSYASTLASWLVWAYDELLLGSNEDASSGGGEVGERDEVVKELVRVAWGNEEVVRILRVLEGRDEGMRERLGGLLDVLGGREEKADGSEMEVDSDSATVVMHDPLGPSSSSLAPAPSQQPSSAEDDVDLDEMETRLKQLSDFLRTSRPSSSSSPSPSTADPDELSSDSPVSTLPSLHPSKDNGLPPPSSGWTLVSEEEWGRGKPIGWFVGE